jgi:hypothetical protein
MAGATSSPTAGRSSTSSSGSPLAWVIAARELTRAERRVRSSAHAFPPFSSSASSRPGRAEDVQAATSKADRATSARPSTRPAYRWPRGAGARAREAPRRARQHGDADYVLEILPEVLEDLRRCASGRRRRRRSRRTSSRATLEYDVAGQVKIRYAPTGGAPRPAEAPEGTQAPLRERFVEHDESTSTRSSSRDPTASSSSAARSGATSRASRSAWTSRASTSRSRPRPR